MNTNSDERGLPREFSGVNRNDILSGGVQMISIDTPKGTFRVWTKRIGNHPTIKVLLLHGGPGMTHEYLEAFDSYFPQVGFELYYYDQLGSDYSDQLDELVRESNDQTMVLPFEVWREALIKDYRSRARLAAEFQINAIAVAIEVEKNLP